uniref:Uncharacterized protein n=1 Tax=Anguilla anguilla TaxID=7936 RepID=A0A0E9VH50_ANGAN
MFFPLEVINTSTFYVQFEISAFKFSVEENSETQF